jgi:hypothetical protein
MLLVDMLLPHGEVSPDHPNLDTLIDPFRVSKLYVSVFGRFLQQAIDEYLFKSTFKYV